MVAEIVRRRQSRYGSPVLSPIQSMNQSAHKVSVLFVCMGNICRSPTAEGVFRQVVAEAGLEQQILIDSAGTHAYHEGEPADRRSQAAAERRGFSLQGIRARRVTDADFERFDYVLAMDYDNLHLLQQQADARHERVQIVPCVRRRRRRGSSRSLLWWCGGVRARARPRRSSVPGIARDAAFETFALSD